MLIVIEGGELDGRKVEVPDDMEPCEAIVVGMIQSPDGWRRTVTLRHRGTGRVDGHGRPIWSEVPESSPYLPGAGGYIAVVWASTDALRLS